MQTAYNIDFLKNEIRFISRKKSLPMALESQGPWTNQKVSSNLIGWQCWGVGIIIMSIFRCPVRYYIILSQVHCISSVKNVFYTRVHFKKISFRDCEIKGIILFIKKVIFFLTWHIFLSFLVYAFELTNVFAGDGCDFRRWSHRG